MAKGNKNDAATLLPRFFRYANALLLLGIFVLAYNMHSRSAIGDRAFISDVAHNEFVRGDFDGNGKLDFTDAIRSLEFQLLDLASPTCLAALDTDDNAVIEISDAVLILRRLFLDGDTPIAPPFPEPGLDPTPDLGCREPPLPGLPEVNSLGGPDREFSEEEALSWRRGRELFDQAFSVEAGLGPLFNGDSCRACHLDPVMGGSGGIDVDVVRFAYVDNGGMVTQLESGPGVSRLSVDGFDRDELDTEANVVETRQTPTLLGLGLVDRIDDSTLLANADPDGTLTPDGISGRAHMVGGRVGRFGHKASMSSLKDFTGDALSNELGLTVDPVHTIFAGISDEDGVSDPEVSDQAFLDMTFFVAHLAPPPRRIPDEPRGKLAVEVGENLFETIGCTSCHLPELAGQDGPVRAYSDFLLHDVADPGRRFVNEPGVEPHEFRTAPLWGLRDTGPYMHDGSAETIVDAIRAHFGEAETARVQFEALGTASKEELIAFLESL